MTARQDPLTDLHLPVPAAGEEWDPHTVHTYYFGLSVPEAALGVVVYYRFQPAFPLVGGGVGIYRGTGNVRPLDVEHLNWWMTMPWPRWDGNVLRTANGLELEVVRPGEEIAIRYASRDGRTSIDVVQRAVTPLTARGSLMPALEGGSDARRQPGGSEQFMHVTGTLVVDGERHDVDCFNVRDRSWCQTRPEAQGIVEIPPLGWTPICFGPDLALNAFSMEPPDTDPAWTGLYDVPADGPFHQGAPYVVRGDEIRAVTSVRRDVLEYHPLTLQAARQVLEVRDEAGEEYRFEGSAIASASLPMWHNIAFVDSVFRWEDASGRTTHASYQECWFDRYQRARRATPAATA
jgi:hypothetical protein